MIKLKLQTKTSSRYFPDAPILLTLKGENSNHFLLLKLQIYLKTLLYHIFARNILAVTQTERKALNLENEKTRSFSRCLAKCEHVKFYGILIVQQYNGLHN